MTRPPSFQAGDTVAIVATARKVSKAEMRPAISILESWGLKVQAGRTCTRTTGSSPEPTKTAPVTCNGPQQQERTGGLLRPRRLRIGADHRQHRLEKFNKDPKWLIGFSDITVIHNHVHRHSSVETLHAPMCLNLPKLSAQCLQVLKDALFGQRLRYSSSKQQPALEKLNRKGKSSGVLTVATSRSSIR